MPNDSPPEDSRSDPSTASALTVSEGALKRAQLRAEYFAIHAAAKAAVREFRRTVMAQGRLRADPDQALSGPEGVEGDPEDAAVSPESAERFLASPAVAVMSIAEFENLGV